MPVYDDPTDGTTEAGATSRLAILISLRDGERCVSDLVESTNLTQSNVSGHLTCLRDCGIVVAESQG